MSDPWGYHLRHSDSECDSSSESPSILSIDEKESSKDNNNNNNNKEEEEFLKNYVCKKFNISLETTIEVYYTYYLQFDVNTSHKDFIKSKFFLKEHEICVDMYNNNTMMLSPDIPELHKYLPTDLVNIVAEYVYPSQIWEVKQKETPLYKYLENTNINSYSSPKYSKNSVNTKLTYGTTCINRLYDEFPLKSLFMKIKKLLYNKFGKYICKDVIQMEKEIIRVPEKEKK